LQKATCDSTRTKRSAYQTCQSTHIINVEAIVTDQGEQKTLTKISTIPAEEETKTGACNG
jgi:hypothetical protein